MEIFSAFCPQSSVFPLTNIRRLPLGGRRGTVLPPRTAVRRGREGYGGHYGGRLVEQDMIVLRKRLRELEIAEGEEESTPAHWPEWERRYYLGRYGDDICDAMAGLQTLLMSTRPAVVLAVISLVAVSLPTAGMAVVLNAAAIISAAIK